MKKKINPITWFSCVSFVKYLSQYPYHKSNENNHLVFIIFDFRGNCQILLLNKENETSKPVLNWNLMKSGGCKS